MGCSNMEANQYADLIRDIKKGLYLIIGFNVFYFLLTPSWFLLEHSIVACLLAGAMSYYFHRHLYTWQRGLVFSTLFLVGYLLLRYAFLLCIR